MKSSCQRCPGSAWHATSSHICLSSEVLVRVSEIAASVGVATSITLSAMLASLLRSIEASLEVKIIWTLGGRRCRNNYLRKEFVSADVPSLSPRSCCILWRQAV